MNAVDTNVFVYALDDSEPLKQSTAIQLLDDLASGVEATVLLWQVAGELLACLRRWESAGRITESEVQESFEEMLDLFPLCIPNAEVLNRSFQLKKRFSISHWDSMLLGASLEAGVSTLYSEDLNTGTSYGGIQVINPFA